MDEPKYELPIWLPWATTACLAALVACLGELWIIERSRSELLKQESLIAETAVKAAQNQLEAERIVSARQLQSLRAAADPQTGLQVVLLLPPAGKSAHPSAAAPVSGVVVLDPAGGRGQLRLFGTFEQSQDRDYQLWIDGPGSEYPARCAVFHAAQDDDGDEAPAALTATVASGCQFLLIEGARGGSLSLEEAKADGSIVLASPPFTGRISGR